MPYWKHPRHRGSGASPVRADKQVPIRRRRWQMLFIVSWSISSENRNRAIERFLKTGGKPPAGVTMKGRWHAVGGSAGFGIAEADDLLLIQKWVLEWNDLMSMEVHAALTDEQMAPLLAGIGK
jgi:hypothetical protein